MNALYIQRRLTSKIMRIVSIVVLVFIIGAYALWRSLNYARGPEIHITSPTNGEVVSATTTDIVGKIERAVNLYLNGKAVNIDEQGNFKETLVIFDGPNVLTLEAKDQFERSVKTELKVFGK